MRRLILGLVLQAILFAACTPTQTTSSVETQSIVITDCVLTSPGVSTQVDAKCGSLAVSEDPANPKSRQINLRVAIIPAIQRVPEADPLFILAGGPGQSIVEAFPALYSSLFYIHQKRDIILVDQRGTGKSNPLRCIDSQDDVLDDQQTIALLKTCPQKLNADLRFYTTDIAMSDLDKVRAALGYEKINLYGISYGTRAALVYLKMYPSHVRSIVLDAVVDPKFVIFQDVSSDAQHALELFFTRCEKDSACNTTFPNLKSEFVAVLNKLNGTPANVTIPHPVTGKPFSITVTPKIFTDIIFNALYMPDLVAMLPLSIHQAYAENNFAPLITQSFLFDPGLYDGMFYSVTCNEDAPLLSSSQPVQNDVQNIFGDIGKSFADVCSAWPHGNPPEVIHEPVTSSTPVLMFSGEADPITPPWHAEQLTLTLANSLNLVFKNMGHGNSNTQCGSQIMEHFIDSASVKNLDITCVSAVEPPPFWVNFSGPQP